MPARALRGLRDALPAFKWATLAVERPQLARLECQQAQFKLAKKVDFRLIARQSNERGAKRQAHGFPKGDPRLLGAIIGPARARWGLAGPNWAAERLAGPQR